MRVRTCLRGMVAAGVAFGGYIAPVPLAHDMFGVSSANAEKFYTRKRVDGVWITGQFPASEVANTTPARRRARPVAIVKPAARKAVVTARATAATAGTATAIVAAEGAASAGAAPASAAPASVAAPALVAPVLAGAEAVPSARSMAATSDPVASSTAIPAESPVEGPAPAGDERLARLRVALLARAQELAATRPSPPPSAFTSATTSAPAPQLPAAPAPASAAAEPAKVQARLEPRSVSYDFETGVKTLVFENSVVREPFDVASVKRLAVPAR